MPLTDLELIHATARELLGSVDGVTLSDKAAPAPFLKWAKSVADGDPISAYKDWGNRILKESFGPPKYNKMELTEAMLYPSK
jgi:hypothetical protein